MNSKKGSGRDVVCPYYRKDVSVAISCESWLTGGVVKLCFPDGDTKKSYLRKRCECLEGYSKCLIARALEHKYAKEQVEP